jgi:gamma-glutamylcyclotransferase (GGCT)/AIG2-like uncharacterized protein YtfP
LFVYGTLRPCIDIPMARWLRRSARYVGHATTSGRLYDLGAYPGMCGARSRREYVHGDVYRVAQPRVLRVLDRYEAGSAYRARYRRERCIVRFAPRGNARKTAWTYRYRYSVVGAPRIVGGDYRVHLALAD